MGKIIAVHSFRGGTGKSNLVANLGFLLAADGLRVGIVDTDIQSPGIHVLFGFDEARLTKSLNDYLWGKAPIEAVAYPISVAGASTVSDLKLWLIPSSIRPEEIARVLRDGYKVDLLNEGFKTLINNFQLDYLLIDTHPGLNEETLLSIAMANAVCIVLRPDQQDFQGTAVTVDIARKLDVPHLFLVVNKALPRYNFAELAGEVSRTFEAEVVGVLPLSEDVAQNASSNIFAAMYPDHIWSQTMRAIASRLVRL
ncbi:MAG: MinD/ParA family protein [Aggregatilineales bacterium]